jgi:hypothetical protein
MNRTVLFVRGILTLIVVLVIFLIRKTLQKPLNLELQQIVRLSLAVLGVISSCQLIYKAFTLEQLYILLQSDIVVLVIGGVAVIWVSAKEIWSIISLNND